MNEHKTTVYKYKTQLFFDKNYILFLFGIFLISDPRQLMNKTWLLPVFPYFIINKYLDNLNRQLKDIYIYLRICILKQEKLIFIIFFILYLNKTTCFNTFISIQNFEDYIYVITLRPACSWSSCSCPSSFNISCRTSFVTRTDLVWIWAVLVQKWTRLVRNLIYRMNSPSPFPN